MIKPTTPEYKKLIKKAEISDTLMEKAQSMVGKNPLRKGAFEILAAKYNKKMPSKL